MRRASKTLTAALAVVLLALGLAACGGGDDSSSTTSAEAGAGQSAGRGSQQDVAKGSGEESDSGKSKAEIAKSNAREASKFTPKPHNDSGGGSEQFRVKGGDNSVQEFGSEADTSELNAAAVALHNFLDARADGNWAAACEYMAKHVIESFEKLAANAKRIDSTDCGAILEQLTNPAAAQAMKEEAAKANVGSLRTEGEEYFVIYTGLDGTILAMPMANEDGEWKVSSLTGTPLN